ncbi:transmembrane protease serine 9-like isoform X2 [Littorina saxatilis]|uniref:transmembrane protease serine 9-like isoform X2 n=1 Tax=Littorina saxatilis TaxID=31220 RepID=UPI0038B44935
MMSAFGAAVVTVLCTALLPVTVSLSEECASVRTPCIEQRTIQQSRNLSYCSVTESYDQCVVNALSEAERSGTCNELQLMTYRYDHEVFKFFHGCSYDLVWPSSFQLNTCHREMVRCGRFLLDMDADKCNKLEAFKSCMEQRTTTCNDRQLVDRLLQVELTDYQYDGTCIVGGIPCGVVRSRRRIAGGRPTAPNQFPWVAMLMHNNGFRSSATIIDPLHVITTAFRVQDVSVDGTFLNTTDLEVIAGKHWTSTSTRYAGEQRVRVASGMMHERYNMTPGVFASNNIAVLRLERPLVFNSLVSALCLPEPSSIVPDECILAAWGKDCNGTSESEFGSLPNQLQFITASAFNQTQCLALRNQIPESYRSGLDTLSPNSMCTANMTHDGEGVCKRDGGSPVFCQKPGSSSYQLLGIISWFFTNNGNTNPRAVPSVSVFIPPYLPWIEATKNTLNTSKCANLPCHNGGTCSDNGDSFYCRCREGFSGTSCQLRGIPCGVVPSRLRIVGGRPTAPNQFPWVAMLVRNGRFGCGAGIIDPLHVITAAHCVDHLPRFGEFLNTTGIEVIAGKHMTGTSSRYTGEQRVNVSGGMLYPDYSSYLDNDIAVLRLARPLEFNSRVSALCLPEPSSQLPEQCTIAGWGRDLNRRSQDKLHFITTEAFNYTQCLKLRDSMPERYRSSLTNILSQNYMCLANTTRGGEGMCNGDSGSPVFCQAPGSNSFQLMGISSWIFLANGGCEKPVAVPSVSTFVPPYVTWINTAKDAMRGPCASLPCQNGGSCADNSTYFTCSCREGYTGDRCERIPSGYATVRLVDGSHSREGRVEIFHSGSWGTVCDDDWDATDAKVVCRELGFSTSAARAYSNEAFGRGGAGSPIWLDGVQCEGNETRLVNCRANTIGVHDCSHYEDAGVSCGAGNKFVIYFCICLCIEIGYRRQLCGH